MTRAGRARGATGRTRGTLEGIAVGEMERARRASAGGAGRARRALAGIAVRGAGWAAEWEMNR
jgi:hypothetical protein